LQLHFNTLLVLISDCVTHACRHTRIRKFTSIHTHTVHDPLHEFRKRSARLKADLRLVPKRSVALMATIWAVFVLLQVCGRVVILGVC